MTIKKVCLFLLLGALASVNYAQENPFGQTLQINTQLKSIVGKPSWLLIIREVETGLVSPYVFDIKNNDNFWIAFTWGHSYRVMASTLQFGPYAVIKNFCRLENGILSGESMVITLKGKLTPYRGSSQCFVQKYKNASFPIVTGDIPN